MRIALIAVAAAALLGAGACLGASQPPTQLSIAVYPNGLAGQGVQRYVLRCGPAGGTLPHPLAACRALARLAHPFAPTPPGTYCTDIAIGPEAATVKGRVRGVPVNTHLTVQGGCEIERWRRVAAVVPGFPGR
jgi:hypothetical protein